MYMDQQIRKERISESNQRQLAEAKGCQLLWRQLPRPDAVWVEGKEILKGD